MIIFHQANAVALSLGVIYPQAIAPGGALWSPAPCSLAALLASLLLPCGILGFEFCRDSISDGDFLSNKLLRRLIHARMDARPPRGSRAGGSWLQTPPLGSRAPVTLPHP